MSTNDAMLSNIADILNKGGWLLRGGKEARHAYSESADLRNQFFREHTFRVVAAEVSGTTLSVTVGVALDDGSQGIAEGTRKVVGRVLNQPELVTTSKSLIELNALYPETQIVAQRDGGGTREIKKSLLALRFENLAIADERSQILSPETPSVLAGDEYARPAADEDDAVECGCPCRCGTRGEKYCASCRAGRHEIPPEGVREELLPLTRSFLAQLEAECAETAS